MEITQCRLADRLETLYLDFDGFFASVMHQAKPTSAELELTPEVRDEANGSGQRR